MRIGATASAIACSGTRNQKVEPLPSWLSRPISPPIISTRRLQMLSPRPVPPKRRVVEPSTWVKG